MNDPGDYGRRDWRSEGRAAAEEVLRNRLHEDRHEGRHEGRHGRDHSGGHAGDPGAAFRSPNPHKLYRNTKEGRIGGVCAGIADYINVNPWIVRLAFVIGVVFFAFAPVFLIGYLVLWMVLRPRPADLYENAEEEVFWRSVTTKPDQTLAGLKAKLRDLDRQIGEMEGFIASKEFDLHRQFRDLERK